MPVSGLLQYSWAVHEQQPLLFSVFLSVVARLALFHTLHAFALNKCASHACIMKVFSYCLEWFSLTRGSSISTSSCCLEGFSHTSLTHLGSVARLECVSAFEICVLEYGLK